MYGQYSAQDEQSDSHLKKFKCLKYSIYVISGVILVSCLLMVICSVYTLVEWSFLDDIMNYDIPVASIWILILGGSMTVLFITFTACAGASRESKVLLLVNIGLLGFTLLLLLAGTLCAILWQTEIGAWVTMQMEKSVKEVYGVDLENNYNRYITQQWDKAQIKMKCCGIRNEGWGIYRQSRWYREQPFIQDGSQQFYYGTEKAMVPESCCTLDGNGRVYNLHKCQRFTDGPPYRIQIPNEQQDYNNALYYDGCYEAAKKWIVLVSSWLMAFGLSITFLMILNIAFSLAFLLMLRQ